MTEYERYQMTPDDVARAIARGDYMEPIESREVVCVGWDGRSNPIHRFRDELNLPEYAQTRIAA